MWPSHRRELRRLSEENLHLLRLVADLGLDRQLLQEIVAQKAEGLRRSTP